MFRTIKEITLTYTFLFGGAALGFSVIQLITTLVEQTKTIAGL